MDGDNVEDDEHVQQTMDHCAHATELIAFAQLLASGLAARQDIVNIRRHVSMLEKYQEQPQLLDKHLPEIIGPLTRSLRAELGSNSLVHYRGRVRNDNDDWEDDVREDVSGHAGLYRILYIIAKVRGPKAVIRLFPHEAMDILPVLMAAEAYPATGVWEGRYVLMLWLSMLCLVPFGIEVVSSDAHLRLVQVAEAQLGEADKTRDAAAYLLARFITRPDMKDGQLPAFLYRCCEYLFDKQQNEPLSVVLRMTGVLAALAGVFKHGRRNDLLPFCSHVLGAVGACELLNSNNALLRKLKVKVMHRIGLTYLPPRIAKWRYQRGNRSLIDNLKNSGVQVSSTVTEAVSQKQKCQNDNNAQENSDIEEDVPEQVEDVIECLLVGLRDKDTIVRWSAAKGVGRVTGRLRMELADDVVGSVLELMSDGESDGAWHGACLCLGELARRGLLLPTRLAETIPLVLKALLFDRRRGSHSVGSHVRDAACYVCWAFARAYSAATMAPYVRDIASCVIQTALTDREVNCRRAAAAAFQECVGRQGSFPHGIDIVQLCDYHAVGLRSNAYLNLCYEVGQFDEYIISLVDHLVDTKTGHWDRAVRDLTAPTLARLVSRCPTYFTSHVVPILIRQSESAELNARHGGLVALGEVMRAICQLQNDSVSLAEAFLDNAIDLLDTIAAKRFRGAGGELTRVAVMTLATCLADGSLSQSTTELPQLLTTKLTARSEKIQAVVDGCVRHTEPAVQEAGALALSALCSAVHVRSPELLARFISKDVSKLVAELRHAGTVHEVKRGLALALGKLPPMVLQSALESVVSVLMEMIDIKSNADPECRVLSIEAVTKIITTVDSQVVLTTHLAPLFVCLCKSTQDYTTDRRGDIGSLVREAGMLALHQLVKQLLAFEDGQRLSDEMLVTVCKLVLQQAVEKIDRTRGKAGELFYSLATGVARVPYREDILQLFTEFDITERTNWSAPSLTFAFFVRLLQFDVYRQPILFGLCVSVGGLTESLVRHSSASLLDFLRLQPPHFLRQILQSLLDIFSQNAHLERIIIPAFKTLDQLLAYAIFQSLIDSGMAEQEFTALADVIGREIKATSDVGKIVCAINVLCGLLSCPSICKTILSQLALLLCHRFPRVRKVAGEQLYTAMITFECEHAGVDETSLAEVQNLLLETCWDANVDEIVEKCNKMCDLLQIPRPHVDSNAHLSTKSKQQVGRDDFASYKDLVDRIGK